MSYSGFEYDLIAGRDGAIAMLTSVEDIHTFRPEIQGKYLPWNWRNL